MRAVICILDPYTIDSEKNGNTVYKKKLYSRKTSRVVWMQCYTTLRGITIANLSQRLLYALARVCVREQRGCVTWLQVTRVMSKNCWSRKLRAFETVTEKLSIQANMGVCVSVKNYAFNSYPQTPCVWLWNLLLLAGNRDRTINKWKIYERREKNTEPP